MNQVPTRQEALGTSSADDLLFHSDRASTTGRTFDAIAQLADVNLEFRDGAAESIAVHAEFARSAALVALVLLQNGENESLLKLAHALGIKNIAAVHLQDECFQLIFHDESLSSL